VTTAAAAWGVFCLFFIPFGPGIPGGVLLAQKHGIGWPWMEALYFLSDVGLALIFEPLMHLTIAAGERHPRLGFILAKMSESTRKTTAAYGTSGSPLALILIAFGVDPMTGRAAAKAHGHGPVSGWALAITGDMLYFTVLMVSTLFLNDILGDGTKTMAVILLLMFVIPPLIKKWRERGARPA